MRIGELIDAINKRDLVLPEFQREYVWNREQAKRLLVSLTKGFPVGSLLFWKTDSPPELKNVDRAPEKLGTVQVILDGQQRLTTLYMFLASKIPFYYTENDITMDPRDLYFNLDNGDFQYYQASLMEGNPLWWRVVDCFKDTQIDVFRIAKQLAGTDEPAFELAQKYNGNLNRLRQIPGVDIPDQTVPSYASLSDAINIFDWVNSQGTKLTDAELALTHVTSKWSQARRTMKQKMGILSRHQFTFDLTFLTRSLTGVVTGRALFETIHDRSKDELVQGWARLDKILDYMVTLLPKRAFIHSTEDLSTTNVLVPWVVYLSRHDVKFAAQPTIKQAVHWLYAAQMWSRYTSQTDQRLEHDVSITVREPDPWSILCNEIIDQRGRLEVKPADLEGRGVLHPLHRMTQILVKAHDAVDWFNGVPLGATTQGQAYRIHSHHIFPTSVLYRHGYDPENHLHRTIINEIANRTFLTAETNQDIAYALPEVYLPKVEAAYPGSLAKQFIPMDPALWTIARFRDFLEARRSLIAMKINEFMQALISEPIVVASRPVAELIKLGEGATLEFKSTLQYDLAQQVINSNLKWSVIKTIAGFLNSEGGTLIIGVEDNGNVCGIAEDLKLVHNSIDKFQQLLVSLMADAMGPEFAFYIKMRVEEINGHQVLVLDVEKSPQPVFVVEPKGKQFYVRVSNTTHALDTEETHRHIQMNWE